MSTSSESRIWCHFSRAGDKQSCVCKLCKKELQTKGGCTSAPRNHLKRFHADMFNACPLLNKKPATDIRDFVDTPDPTSLTIPVDDARYDSDGCKSRALDRAVSKFIVDGYMPYSVVENPGFKEMLTAFDPKYRVKSRGFYADTDIPMMYAELKEDLRGHLSGVNYISLTTDEWSDLKSGVQLLSVTCHWITDDFHQRHAVLAAAEFSESHTSANIATKLQLQLDEVGVSNGQVHLVTRDGAAAMKRATEICGFHSQHCFSHVLNLIINDSVFNQPSISHILDKARNLASHVSRSPRSQNILNGIQKGLCMEPPKKLLQDVRTRWNSTLVCIRRLLELKSAVVIYLLDTAAIDITFSESEWETLSRLITILTPFEELTRDASREDTTVSFILPAIKVLTAFLNLQKTATENEKGGIDAVVNSLCESTKRRFEGWNNVKNLLMATMLDPRYKSSVCDSAGQNIFKGFVLQEADMQIPSTLSNKTAKSSCASSLQITSIWELSEEASPTEEDNKIELQLQKYLLVRKLDRSGCPFQWWRSNKREFPLLYSLAQKYLSAPATSVSSERLFSSAGLIYSDRRKSLKPIKAQQLLFCKAHLAFTNRNMQSDTQESSEE